jgi:hypothetical protein
MAMLDEARTRVEKAARAASRRTPRFGHTLNDDVYAVMDEAILARLCELSEGDDGPWTSWALTNTRVFNDLQSPEDPAVPIDVFMARGNDEDEDNE